VLIKPSGLNPSLFVSSNASWLLSVSSDFSRLLIIASYNPSLLITASAASPLHLIIPKGLIEIGKVHGQRVETQNTLFSFVVSYRCVFGSL
jgi:RNase P/RNase MRP subunit p30